MQGSKTNQHGELENKAVFYAPDELFCPVRAVLEWKELLGRTTGPYSFGYPAERPVSPPASVSTG